ncbi:hypothetical protein [Pseudonocardia xishanensis]|uniref:hypothetical protein n=1 Tax=Pseudonocardia xishanensis TaxID=630995 RepID=UPI0031E8DF11
MSAGRPGARRPRDHHLEQDSAGGRRVRASNDYMDPIASAALFGATAQLAAAPTS